LTSAASAGPGLQGDRADLSRGLTPRTAIRSRRSPRRRRMRTSLAPSALASRRRGRSLGLGMCSRPLPLCIDEFLRRSLGSSHTQPSSSRSSRSSLRSLGFLTDHDKGTHRGDGESRSGTYPAFRFDRSADMCTHCHFTTLEALTRCATRARLRSEPMFGRARCDPGVPPRSEVARWLSPGRVRTARHDAAAALKLRRR
jgi:hypothetical protein